MGSEISKELDTLTMNAPERAEYAKALIALAPVLYNLPPKIIAIDGRSGTGKTTLGRFLAWRFNITLLETDLYLIPDLKSLEYRTSEVEAVIASRIQKNRPIIVEGMVALRLLGALQRTPDFHIRVICHDAVIDPALEAEWLEYQEESHPRGSTSLDLDLPFRREI